MKADFLVLYKETQVLTFWQDIAPYFADLATWTFCDMAELTQTDLRAYQGILTTQPVETDLPSLVVDPTDSPWKVSKDIHQFIQQTSKSFLDYLPWRVSFFAPDGQLIYSNGRADGSFFFLDEDIPPLEDWILQDLKASSTGVLHLPLSLESFDQKIVQSFQTLYDDQKNLIGIFQYTQEISDLLASYLEDSGQALVGWSDVTSGASISNQD